MYQTVTQLSWLLQIVDFQVRKYVQRGAASHRRGMKGEKKLTEERA